MEIIDFTKKTNELLSRTEVSLNLLYEGKTTPSLADLKKEVVAKLSADETCVAVKRIDGKFGGGTGTAVVYIYKSAEDLKTIEPRVKVKKK